MITDLCEMMVQRLLLFKARSNTLPEQVLVYRDGVSEVSDAVTLSFIS
jgi:hypothetical protein